MNSLDRLWQQYKTALEQYGLERSHLTVIKPVVIQKIVEIMIADDEQRRAFLQLYQAFWKEYSHEPLLAAASRSTDSLKRPNEDQNGTCPPATRLRLESNNPTPMVPPSYTTTQFNQLSKNNRLKTLAEILDMDLLADDSINWLRYEGYSNSPTPYKLPEGITFASWESFQRDLSQFYDREDVKVATSTIYLLPERTVDSYCTTDASHLALFNELFNDTLNRFFLQVSTERSPNKKTMYMMHLEKSVGRIRSDFWFSHSTITVGNNSIEDPRCVEAIELMPLVVKRVAVIKVTRRSRDLLYQLSINNADFINPTYQLVTYMNAVGANYGVLTTGYQTWVFRRCDNHVFQVSPMQEQKNWLRVIYYACWMAKEEFEEEERKYDPATSVLVCNAQQPPRHQLSEQNSFVSSSSLNSSPSTASGLTSQTSANQMCLFPDIDIEITNQELGEGRSGVVYLGRLLQQNARLSVAVKVCNEAIGIREEMENEALVLKYANSRGVQCVPRIFYSGQHQKRFINVVELFDSSSYYQKSLERWDKLENRLFDRAQRELQENHIEHGDVRKENVFFSFQRDHCKIIDFGYSKILCSKPLIKQVY